MTKCFSFSRIFTYIPILNFLYLFEIFTRTEKQFDRRSWFEIIRVCYEQRILTLVLIAQGLMTSFLSENKVTKLNNVKICKITCRINFYV